MLWLPWALFVVGMGLFSGDDNNALQRSLILIAPIVVGAAASSFNYGRSDVSVLYKMILWSAFILVGVVCLKVAILKSVEVTRLATEAIAAVALVWALLTALRIARDHIAQAAVVLLLLVPIFATTRGALVASVLAIPFALPFMGLRRVVMLVLLIIGVLGALLVTYAPIKEKMVYGDASMSDVLSSPEVVRTSGRLVAWELMWENIRLKPVLGHGANASEGFLVKRYSEAFAHPHNDYMRILFDYGWVGLLIFLATVGIQLRRLIRGARTLAVPEFKFVAYSAASLFIPFLLLMSVDNIILYAAFFGNLHFLLVGVAESRKNRNRGVLDQSMRRSEQWDLAIRS